MKSKSTGEAPSKVADGASSTEEDTRVMALSTIIRRLDLLATSNENYAGLLEPLCSQARSLRESIKR